MITTGGVLNFKSRKSPSKYDGVDKKKRERGRHSIKYIHSEFFELEEVEDAHDTEFQSARRSKNIEKARDFQYGNKKSTVTINWSRRVTGLSRSMCS